MGALLRSQAAEKDITLACYPVFRCSVAPGWLTTLAELQARIAKTLDFLKSVTAAQVQGAETRTIEIKFPNGAWWARRASIGRPARCG